MESPQNSERPNEEPRSDTPQYAPDMLVQPERPMSDAEIELSTLRENNNKEIQLQADKEETERRKTEYWYQQKFMEIEERQTALQRQADSADKQAQQRIRYGLIAVISGLGILAALYIASLFFFTSQGQGTDPEQMANNIVASMGVVTGVIGSLVSAYFGIQLGSAGRERAESQRDRAVAGSQAPPASPSDNQ